MIKIERVGKGPRKVQLFLSGLVLLVLSVFTYTSNTKWLSDLWERIISPFYP